MANPNGSGQLAEAAFYRAGFHAKAQRREEEKRRGERKMVGKNVKEKDTKRGEQFIESWPLFSDSLLCWSFSSEFHLLFSNSLFLRLSSFLPLCAFA
jgi:hypothetical protein